MGLKNNFHKIVGDGANIDFLFDSWVEDDPLKNRFNQLFRIGVQRGGKGERDGEMGSKWVGMRFLLG